MSDAVGKITVYELHNFTKDDLDENDVFVLDAITELYVWIGRKSREQEHKVIYIIT